MLKFDRKQQNSVKQLSFNKINYREKKKGKKNEELILRPKDKRRAVAQ